MQQRSTIPVLIAIVALLIGLFVEGVGQTTTGRDSAHKSSRELRDAALFRAEPEYPPLARAARVSGIVEVEETMSEKDRGEDDRHWAANLRICREQTGRQSPDNRKLATALAHLCVAARDEERVEQALNVFDDAERRGKLPVEAKAYCGKLLLEKHNYELQRAMTLGEDPSSTHGFLFRALQLFFDSYNDELSNKSIDAVRLADIARFVARVYRVLGKNEEALEWLQRVASGLALSDALRAEIHYELGVSY